MITSSQGEGTLYYGSHFHFIENIGTHFFLCQEGKGDGVEFARLVFVFLNSPGKTKENTWFHPG
jgi:hypothetical protein